MSGWTDERVELLRKLWGEGLSASQVASELGPGMTRNAIIGKLHRLGIAERAKTSSAPRPRRAPRVVVTPPSVNKPKPTQASPPVASSPAVQPIAPAIEEIALPISGRVTLMALKPLDCRWPMGDPTMPEFRFCGGRQCGAVSGGMPVPYCSHHARIAYQPAQDRRRARIKLDENAMQAARDRRKL